MKPEAILQSNCIQWLKLQHPTAFYTHVPNEAKRSFKTIGALKKMGWVAGCPDLLIFNKNNQFNGLAIEFKVGKNKLTESQQYFMNRLGLNGWFCKQINALDDFIYFVNCYFYDM